MANIPEPQDPGFTGVYEWDLNDDVIGGPNGIATKPIKQLVERTAFLKKTDEDLQEQIDDMKGQGITALYAQEVDGYGRNLLTVFGLATFPEAMAEIRRRCNNNGEIDNTGVPDFSGLMIGDYIDGLDLSGIVAPTNGTTPQAWNNTYKNNRIVISGFNTYKGSGNTENNKNHILFTFRNVIAKGRINSTDTNTGGYQASEMRIWLEGANGDGSGAFALGLKAALGGEYLYTVHRLLSIKGDWNWQSYTVFLPTEHEIFGSPHWSEPEYGDGLAVQIPLYQKSAVYRIKRWNGSRAWYWEASPIASNSTNFCYVGNDGVANPHTAGNTGGGVAPAFCVR